MKRKRFIVLFLALALAGGVGLAYGQQCQPVVADLVYGATYVKVGTVTVWNDTENLYVNYQVTTPGIALDETHVAICNELFSQRPEPGHSCYMQNHAFGTTSYTYTIPLNNVLLHPDCPECQTGQVTSASSGNGKKECCSIDLSGPACGAFIYLATHAALSNGETAYGKGECQAPGGGAGAWFCQIPYEICCEAAPPPPPGACEDTAWGYASGALCFINIKELKSNNWGWTYKIPEPGVYTLTLYAGAGQCNLSKGTAVGTVTVNYSGTTVTVNYTPYPGYTFEETHVWIGSTPLPYKNKKKPSLGYTAAPGQFPYKDGASVNVNGWNYIYVAAHAKVAYQCGTE